MQFSESQNAIVQSVSGFVSMMGTQIFPMIGGMGYTRVSFAKHPYLCTSFSKGSFYLFVWKRIPPKAPSSLVQGFNLFLFSLFIPTYDEDSRHLRWGDDHDSSR